MSFIALTFNLFTVKISQNFIVLKDKFMKFLRLLAPLCLLVSVSASAKETVGQSLLKKRVLSDLNMIHNIFEVKYAPKVWKHEFANWDLDQAIQDAKNKIESHPAPTLKECQTILRDFFNSTRDYHVGIKFFSTESATLPFCVKGAQGRYFVAWVEKDHTARKDFPFEEGDEILMFDERPIGDVIEELRLKEFGNNTFETDQALAEMALTQRKGDWGHTIPKGLVTITGYRKGDPKKTTVVLNWSYTPEKINDFSKIGKETSLHLLARDQEPKDFKNYLTKNKLFEKLMVSALWDKPLDLDLDSDDANKHTLGARKSFIPSLGPKIWKSATDSSFDAYIFESPTGKKIGYLRLPHYVGEEDEVDEFGKFMNYFERRTDALIIDQVNNPGGSVFYLYALVATLTNKPFFAPKHHIALTQEEIHLATFLIPYLDKVTNDESARTLLGETLGGYPIDFRFVKLMKKFCHFMLAQWDEGKLYSDPTHLFGVDEIRPHPQYNYTKPILLLINSLDFSGGDFFPAILQDNKRATIFGTRTAGAGGYVLSTEFPNHSGIKGFVMTGSLAERIDQRPIENLGVRPDIAYDLTAVDLQENFVEYVAAILEAVEKLVEKK